MTRSPSPLDDSSTRGLSVDAELVCRDRAQTGRHPALGAIRAITHVDGKAIGSSHRARRGAGCWDDHGASGGTPILSSRWRGGGRRRPVVLSWGAPARTDVPVGEGSAPATLRTIKRPSTAAAGLRSLSRGCGRRDGSGRRARVSSRAGASGVRLRRSHPGESSSQSSPTSVFVSSAWPTADCCIRLQMKAAGPAPGRWQTCARFVSPGRVMRFRV